MLERDGVAPSEAQSFRSFLDMRYPGQAYEIQVPLEGRPDAASSGAARRDSTTLHMAQYAHAERHVAPEIVAVRLAATGRLEKPVDSARSRRSEGGTAKGMRRVFAEGAWQRRRSGTARRSAERPSAGPLIVEEEHATHAIPPGWTLRVTAAGDLIASRTRRPR